MGKKYSIDELTRITELANQKIRQDFVSMAINPNEAPHVSTGVTKAVLDAARELDQDAEIASKG